MRGAFRLSRAFTVYRDVEFRAMRPGPKLKPRTGRPVGRTPGEEAGDNASWSRHGVGGLQLRTCIAPPRVAVCGGHGSRMARRQGCACELATLQHLLRLLAPSSRSPRDAIARVGRSLLSPATRPLSFSFSFLRFAGERKGGIYRDSRRELACVSGQCDGSRRRHLRLRGVHAIRSRRFLTAGRKVS